MPKEQERQLPPVEIDKQWMGLVLNSSPLAVPPGGATKQNNVCCLSPGILQTRGGIRDVVFEN